MHLNRSRPFQQRTNTSCYLAIPTHGFTVVLSVFGGTPPAKPLNCKSFSNRLGAPFRSRRAEPSGGKPWLPGLRIRLALSDITWTSLRYRSPVSCLSLLFAVVTHSQIIQDNKKPCLLCGKQGWRNSISTRYLLTFPLSKLDSGVRPPYALDSLRLNAQPWLNRL